MCDYLTEYNIHLQYQSWSDSDADSDEQGT